MSDKIWLYWEGPMPEYISLCCETVFAHNKNVVLLDRSSFGSLFTNDCDINIDRLALNYKSDFIRAYLLKHYGGLYVDADCIVMQNFFSVLDSAKMHGFVGYREPQGYMSCNFMASRENGAVISEHYDKICTKVRKQEPLGWLDLASVPMNEAVDRYPKEAYLLPTDLIMPVSWNESPKLCVRRDDENHEKHYHQEALCYMLSNNTISSRDETRVLCYMPKSHLLNDRYFISYLFRRSLNREPGNCQNIPPYLGGHENKTLFDVGALDYLVSHYCLKSMVDVGCGQPGMVYYALSKGIRAVGIDGDPTIASDCPVIIMHDYTKGPLYLGEFDLGWSVEFVEHVEKQYIPNFMATLLCCRHVFITAAVPGQPGYHHVNCQNGDYWISQFESSGFMLDHEATEGVRSHSTMNSHFTEQTGLVFNRT